MVRYSGVLGVEEPHQSIPNLVVKLYCGEGQSFFLVFSSFLFIKELNNEDRWQVPDRFDHPVWALEH